MVTPALYKGILKGENADKFCQSPDSPGFSVSHTCYEVFSDSKLESGKQDQITCELAFRTGKFELSDLGLFLFSSGLRL